MAPYNVLISFLVYQRSYTLYTFRGNEKLVIYSTFNFLLPILDYYISSDVYIRLLYINQLSNVYIRLLYIDQPSDVY